ncbi:MAG TPA: hypothetical protein VG318_08895 [Actinomycetota bacterium]|nr:hypothetical protein [Actinomycetota bacterium]
MRRRSHTLTDDGTPPSPQKTRGTPHVPNSAIATAVARSQKGTGELAKVIKGVAAMWDRFEYDRRKMRDVLYAEFLPLLWSHSAAAGKTKDEAKVVAKASTQLPPAVIPAPLDQADFTPPTLTRDGGFSHDPDKKRAVSVGYGVIEWTKSATQAAERYYGEMRSAKDEFKSVSLNWRPGRNDTTEPDRVHSQPQATASRRPKSSSHAPGEVGKSLEVKHTDSDDQGEVDKLIQEAREQSAKRQSYRFLRPIPTFEKDIAQSPKPGASAFGFTDHVIYIEIANPENPWPFTPTTVPAGGAATDPVVLRERAGARTLGPGGIDRIVVKWLGSVVVNADGTREKKPDRYLRFTLDKNGRLVR